MPVFTVTGPDGRTLKVEGEELPSESELDSIFSEASNRFSSPVPNKAAPVPESTTPLPIPPEWQIPRSGMERAAQQFNSGFREPYDDAPVPHGVMEALSQNFLGPDIPRVESPSNDFIPSAAAATFNTIGGAANFIRSPLGGLATAAAAIPGVAPIIAALFTGDMGYHGGKTIDEAIQTGNVQQGMEGAAQAGMAFLPAAHARQAAIPESLKPQTTGVTDASRLSEAAKVHGDLRELGQAASEVSPEVSREGVQSRAEAATQEGQQRVLLTPEEWGRDVAPVLDEVSDANVVVGKTRRGAIAEFDPTTGDVVLSDTEFADWLRGVEPSKRQAAVRATIAEEVNHKKFKEATTAEERAAYWENLSALEKALHMRAYTGEWSTQKAAGAFREGTGRELTPELLGYEAANARQMRLARMTRREVLEAVGRERWTVQSVDALANMLFKTREAIGTKASKEQIALLDRIEANLAVARTAVAAPQQPEKAKTGDVAAEDQPFAFNKDRERFTPVLETASGQHYPGATHTDALKRATQDMKDGKISPDEFMNVLEASDNDAQHKFRAADGTILTRDQLAERTGGLRQSEQLRDAGLIESPESAPAAFNRQAETNPEKLDLIKKFYAEMKRTEQAYDDALQSGDDIGAANALNLLDKQNDFYKFVSGKGLVQYDRGLQDDFRPDGPGVFIGLDEDAHNAIIGAGENETSFPAAFRRKGPKDTSEQQFMFLPPVERGLERDRPVETITPQKISSLAEKHLTEGAPNFKEFVGESQREFGHVQKGQLRDVWEDAVWKKLMSASGEQLQQLRTELKLGRHFGTRDISDAPQPGMPTNRGREKYRNAVLRGIATKLIGQTEEGRSTLRRSTLSPDDIAWNRPSSFNAFREISADEAANPQMLERLATDGFRASAQAPETHTRRVLALVNKSTGEVELVSTYLHPRRGAMVVDPKLTGKMRPNVSLASLTKNYRPIATVLLDEPVQNFRQRFDSVGRFNEEFADQARNELQSQASHEASLAEGAGVLGGEEEAPSVIRSGERVTDAEAGTLLDHLMDEHGGSVNGPEDVLQTISELGEKPNWQVIAAYNKMFEAIRERLPELTPQQAVEQLADEIYDYQKTSKTRDEFVSRALKAYHGELPEAGQGTAEALPTKTGRALAMRERPAPIEGTPMVIREGPRKPMQDMPGGQSAPAAFRKTPTTKKEFLKNLLTTPGAGFSRWYSEWMSEAVRSQGGAQASRAADTADAITDRAKSLYGSELTPTLDKAKELAGGAPRRGLLGQMPSPSLIKANAWLDKLNHPVSERTGVANVVDAIEGRAIVPSGARATVDAAKAADAEAMKLVAAVVPGWKGKGAFQRNMTGFGFDILTEGPTSKSPSDLWNTYTRDTAILNHKILNARRVAAKEPTISVGEEIRQTRRFFVNMRDAFRDNADANRIEKINQDFARLYPKALTHIKTASGWQEMMHTSLFNYLENVAQRAAHTRAFREQFPLNAAGKLDFDQLDAGVRSELPATSIPYWDALVKTMQGRPTDSYLKAGALRPGQPLGELVKGLNQTAMSTLKRLALTGQMVTQIPETVIGSGVAELGMMNRLRSLVKLKQLWPEMEKQGQVNQLLYDWSYDPKNPVRSLFRQGNNLLSKVFAENFLNEFQGKLGAAIATSAADRIRNQAAEPLSNWEKRQYPETFRKMQFTPDQVSALMAGDPILLKAFERRAPAWLTTENRAKTETSLAGNNRLLNSIFPFQMYPMNKLNQFRRNYQRFGEAWRSGDKGQLFNAGEGMARFLFSTSAQGAAYTLLASYAFGGKEGLKIKANEAADEPFEFLAESLMATLGGPYYLLWQGARRNGVAGIGEQATRTLFPYTQAADLRDALQGNGQYRDQDVTQRIGRLLQQKTPGLRIGKQALAIFGLGQESGPTEQAIKGFYRWKLDTFGPDNTQFDSPEDRKVFRSHMRRAVEAIKSGDADAYDEAIFGAKQEAVKRTSVAQSFRARMLLKNPSGEDLTDEELDAVSKRIGEDALQRLQDYDAMLEQAAKGWTPSGLK